MKNSLSSSAIIFLPVLFNALYQAGYLAEAFWLFGFAESHHEIPCHFFRVQGEGFGIGHDKAAGEDIDGQGVEVFGLDVFEMMDRNPGLACHFTQINMAELTNLSEGRPVKGRDLGDELGDVFIRRCRILAEHGHEAGKGLVDPGDDFFLFLGP